jgi:MoaA/NifB/PqqE/SkfB family radical SAM enzyme
LNNTFCILPWVHTHLKPNGDVHLCSRKSIPLGNIQKESLNDIFHSSIMDSIRTKMVNGEKVEGCEKCYHTETISEVSLRKFSNWWFKGFLIDNEVLEWKDDTIYDGTDYSDNWPFVFKDIVPSIKWLAFHASNVCNLACRGCYSMLSSKWKKDEVKLGINPYPLHDDDLFKFDLGLSNMNFITMFGGEPLIMKQNDQLMDLLNNSKDINNKILQYYTNATILPNKKTLGVWKKIKKLQLFISIDGYGAHNDYFRHGSKWDIVSKNITVFQNYASKYNWDVKTTTVINIYNVRNLNLLHNWLCEMGLDNNQITYNLCIYPQELDIRNLPAGYKEKIVSEYKNLDIPTNLKDLVLGHLQSEPTIDFLAVSAFSNKLDEIRKQSNPLPELKVYMDNGKI